MDSAYKIRKMQVGENRYNLPRVVRTTAKTCSYELTLFELIISGIAPTSGPIAGLWLCHCETQFGKLTFCHLDAPALLCVQ